MLTRPEPFDEGVRRVIGLGGDTDTNAAVAGAVLGARDGASALPQSWLDSLVDREDIEREATGLVRFAELR
jgi:ADP-ribosylglycohydrolase